MSLYFKERVQEEEQIAAVDPKKDKITFIFPWIIDIPLLPEDAGYMEITNDISLSTIYNIQSTQWYLIFTNDYFKIQSEEPFLFWSESKFFISYKLYFDNEMRSEIYSSKRIAFENSYWSRFSNCVFTPDGAMIKFSDAFFQRKLAKMVVFVEFVLPKKYFDRPFDFAGINYDEIKCEKYPDDLDSDFRFEFLKESDFTFKCLDGTIPALKMVMNVTPLKKYLNKSSNDELIVNHDVDVVKPIITYFHSQCFEMPKSYDLDYADRLLNAAEFFELEDEEKLKMVGIIHDSLCQKFTKDPHNFELILQWASVASRHCWLLTHMISVVIAQKYYYQWLERFPVNARIAENQMLQNIFGSTDKAFWIFQQIENSFMCLLFIKTIMP